MTTSPGYINLKIKEFERSAIICQGHGVILFSPINKYTLLLLPRTTGLINSIHTLEDQPHALRVKINRYLNNESTVSFDRHCFYLTRNVFSTSD